MCSFRSQDEAFKNLNYLTYDEIARDDYDAKGFGSSHLDMSDSLQPHGLQHAGFLVHHQLQELAQTHVHRGSDVIQPSHPLSSPSPPAFSLSQHQGLLH